MACIGTPIKNTGQALLAGKACKKEHVIVAHIHKDVKIVVVSAVHHLNEHKDIKSNEIGIAHKNTIHASLDA